MPEWHTNFSFLRFKYNKMHEISNQLELARILLFKMAESKMKSQNIYEIEMLNGKPYRVEIAYIDEKMMLKLIGQISNQKLDIFYEWVVSIRNLVDKDFVLKG